MKTFLTSVIALLLLGAGTTKAQDKKFTSSAAATKFINEICNKYWLINTKQGDISREITVYQHGCQLFFNERSVMRSKTEPEGGEAYNTLISVNLRKVKQIGNYNMIEFAGGKKDIVTLNTRGNAQFNAKGEYSSRYRVALDYANPVLKNTLYDLTTAVDYLLKQCHSKAVKKGKKKVHHK